MLSAVAIKRLSLENATEQWRLGGSQQRRDRLHARKQLLTQPRRSPVRLLRYFTLSGTDHASHNEQGSMIRRYTVWRNRHADDRRLRAVVSRAKVA
jgi:hypothetical protein